DWRVGKVLERDDISDLPLTESELTIGFTYCQMEMARLRWVSVKSNGNPSCKRPYELGKRLEQLGRTKAAVLSSARAQLESGGMREFSMESLAKASGVTRQTI